MKTNFLLLWCFFICTINLISGEQLYIVTSPESPCPTREQGEPCLTLEQYTAYPSRSPTVTLVMEPGNHTLKESIRLTSSTVTNFTMISEGATIILDHEFKFTSYGIYASTIFGIDQGYVRLNGITFRSGNSVYNYNEIYINSLQEVTFQDCSLQEVGIHMYEVANATFLRCNISNNRYMYKSALYILGYHSTVISFMQSNFFNNTGAIYFQRPKGYYYHPYSPGPGNLASLVIIQCSFINNTSEFHGGGAVYVTGDYYTVTVSQSTFIYNTASGDQEYISSRSLGGGGAINLDGTCINCTISTNIFISNSAHHCGALVLSSASVSGQSNESDVSIIDSAFYYNSAIDELSVGGGAACINDVSVSITNSTFVANSAVGYGGAVVVNNSTITITDTVFSNNTAGLSGGALITYVYPSNYTIDSCTFIDNRAGDDGGAMFIGRSGSDVTVESSNFLRNHAADRGGAITVFESSVTVYYGTNIYNNSANVAQVISACNSQITLPIIVQSRRPDPTYSLCTVYDDEIYFNTPTIQELPNYQDVIMPVNDRENDGSSNLMVNRNAADSQLFQSINSKLHQATIIMYISLSLSVILTVAFLLLGIATLTMYCKLRHGELKMRSKSLHNVNDQPESIYDLVDTKGIEVKNIISSKT